MPERLSTKLTRDPAELRKRFLSLRTAEDVADLLEVPYGHLTHILYWGRRRYPYRKFLIRKRFGHYREIEAPPPSLRILQSKLNGILQQVYRRKPSAHGFVRGYSILSNARNHTGRRFVLNLDLEDFFPSINFGRVRGVFMARPYSLPAPAATVLAQICCHDGRLPQGAPTSPIVSNMVCAKLDGDLQSLAKKYRCTYTRYADDITLSTTVPKFPREVASPLGGLARHGLVLGEELTGIVEANGFSINTEKQRLQLRDGHQEVTGLTVNKFPNVSRRFVRQVRAMLHASEAYGLQAAEQVHREKYARPSRSSGKSGPGFAKVVRGKLAFLAMVKGEDDPAYRRFRNRLNRLDPNLIDALPAQTPIDALALSLQYQRPAVTQHVAPDGTLTILFTDIESSTQLNEALGDARWMAVLREHNQIIRHRLREYGGHEVKTIGDAFMVVFRSAVDALRCVISIQQDLAARNETSGTPVHVRTGLHTGEPVKEAEDFYGYHVNYASRVAHMAAPGQILVSTLVKELVLPSGLFTLSEEEPTKLKGFKGTHVLYSVGWSGRRDADGQGVKLASDKRR